VTNGLIFFIPIGRYFVNTHFSPFLSSHFVSQSWC